MPLPALAEMAAIARRRVAELEKALDDADEHPPAGLFSEGPPEGLFGPHVRAHERPEREGQAGRRRRRAEATSNAPAAVA